MKKQRKKKKKINYTNAIPIMLGIVLAVPVLFEDAITDQNAYLWCIFCCITALILLYIEWMPEIKRDCKKLFKRNRKRSNSKRR